MASLMRAALGGVDMGVEGVSKKRGSFGLEGVGLKRHHWDFPKMQPVARGVLSGPHWGTGGGSAGVTAGAGAAGKSLSTNRIRFDSPFRHL